MKLQLRPYQQEAVDSVYRYLREHDDNPCVVMSTGSGKSVVIGKIASDAVSLWNGRVLILAHVKELLEQNASKVVSLVDGIPVGIYSAGLNSRDTDTPIVVAGIQSVYNKADVLGSFDLIVVDECFPCGILIDTPRGKVAIEDLYIGQPVYHAMGVGEIEAISAKPAWELVEIELNDGKKIRCTPNHPFFTESGWKKAESLAMGESLFSRKDVSSLQKRVSPKCVVHSRWNSKKMSIRERLGAQSFLFSNLSTKKPQKSCDKKRKKANVERNSKNIAQRMFMLRKNISSSVFWRKTNESKTLGKAKVLLNILLKEGRELYVQPRDCGKSIKFVKTKEISSQTQRWKRQRFNKITRNNLHHIAGNTGIPRKNNTCSTISRSSKLLQGRCCNSKKNVCDSIGWKKSSIKKNSQIRQENNHVFNGIRVVSITHIKLKNPCIVYNLQVGGHPSYYADGYLVHNCHLIAPDGEGMYRTFLQDMKLINPHVRVVGFTATPYRLKGGLICQPENILNSVCYEIGVKEMIAQGYLSPLISRAGRVEAKLTDLHVRGGEFLNAEITAAMDKEEITNAACNEIVQLTKERKSVLIFATSVEHCEHIAERLRALGQVVEIVTGDTPAAERAELLDRFKGKSVPADLLGNMKPPLKFLVNVNVLTTGFDAPNVDCVVLLRPTASAGLYVQMVGRGFRLSPQTGKTDCLVLDYGENVLRHGPVDCVTVKDKTSGKGKAPAKKCPECLALIHAGYSKCPECGYEFPPPETTNLQHKASNAGILSGQAVVTEYSVGSVSYSVHHKRGADESVPCTMRIDYEVGFHQFKSEWVCPEHTGYARGKFERWWKERAADGCPMPDTAAEAVALANKGYLAEPMAIKVKQITGDKYERICSWMLKDKPITEPGAFDDFAEEYHSNSPGDLGVAQDNSWMDDAIPF